MPVAAFDGWVHSGSAGSGAVFHVKRAHAAICPGSYVDWRGINVLSGRLLPPQAVRNSSIESPAFWR